MSLHLREAANGDYCSFFFSNYACVILFRPSLKSICSCHLCFHCTSPVNCDDVFRFSFYFFHFSIASIGLFFTMKSIIFGR